jgi:glutathionylspermidine synthase
MTTRRRIHSTLTIHGVGFQYRTHEKEEQWQNSVMYRFS